MESSIGLVNSLHDVASRTGLNFGTLPSIIVIGSQSVGKSTVLESIVGLKFLPKGKGTVTRCPIKIHVSKHPQATGQPYCEFHDGRGLKIYDFNVVQDEIKKRSERIIQKGQVVSNTPISLQIFTNDVPALTIIDLPGVVSYCETDPSGHTIRETERIAKEYAADPSNIILAIAEANTDLMNSKGYGIACEFDPDRTRTIRMLTKCDQAHPNMIPAELFDEGSAGQHPIVPVMNYIASQSPRDIMSMDISVGEDDFFAKSAMFSQIKHRCGKRYLRDLLSAILSKTICAMLPNFKKTIIEEQQKCIEERQQIFEMNPESKAGTDRRDVLNRIINDYQNRVRDMLFDSSRTMSELQNCAANIRRYTGENLMANMLEKAKSSNPPTDEEIERTIANAPGLRRVISDYEFTIEPLTNKILKSLYSVPLDALNSVTDEITNLFREAAGKTIKNKNVVQFLLDKSTDHLSGRFKAAKDQIKMIVKSEGYAQYLPPRVRTCIDDIICQGARGSEVLALTRGLVIRQNETVWQQCSVKVFTDHICFNSDQTPNYVGKLSFSNTQLSLTLPQDRKLAMDFKELRADKKEGSNSFTLRYESSDETSKWFNKIYPVVHGAKAEKMSAPELWDDHEMSAGDRSNSSSTLAKSGGQKYRNFRSICSAYIQYACEKITGVVCTIIHEVLLADLRNNLSFALAQSAMALTDEQLSAQFEVSRATLDKLEALRVRIEGYKEAIALMTKSQRA